MVMRYTSLWTIVILMVTTTALADEPTLGDLIRLAPVIQSSDEKYRSIELEGSWLDDDGNVMLRFRSIYRAPDHHSLLLADGRDGTPLTFVSDRKLMSYDPIQGCAYFSNKAGAGTRIGVEDGCFRYSWPLSIESDEPSYLKLDLKSMLDGPSRRDKLVKTGEGKYRLTRTSTSGNNYVLSIDLSANNPFEKIEIHIGQTKKVRLCLDKIAINGPLPDEQFAFPSKELLAEKIPVKDYSVEHPLEAIKEMGSIMRVCYARMAVNRADLRDAPNLFNLYGMSKIDWAAIQENDKKFSGSIKKLIDPKSR